MRYDSDEEDLDVYGQQRPPPSSNPFASSVDRYAPAHSRYDSQNPGDFTARAPDDFGFRDDDDPYRDEASPKAPIVQGVNKRLSRVGFGSSGSQRRSGQYDDPELAIGHQPLASAGVLPAGREDAGHGWRIDEDDEEQIAARLEAERRTAQSRGKARGSLADLLRDRLLFWRTGRVLEGERLIHVNDPAANAPSKFTSNYVSTSKYNLVTFLPKFLLEQFSKYAVRVGGKGPS